MLEEDQNSLMRENKKRINQKYIMPISTIINRLSSFDATQIRDDSKKEDKDKNSIQQQKQMLKKLGVLNIPSMQFIEADRILTFSDLYSFKKILGYGGFGFVVAAKDKQKQKNVALKIVIQDEDNPDNINMVQSIKKEAKLLQELQHENIIKMYSLDIYQNYLVMSLKLTYENIYEYQYKKRKQGEPLNEEQCAQIMQGIFNGLRYLHDEKNIIHRDMKLANVVLGSYNDLSKVKIIDFGLAVYFKQENISDYFRCGTLIYQPPEQANNEFLYGKMADMWATGIIMYELITGEHPFYKAGMSRDRVIEILTNFKGFKFPQWMSPQAVHLIKRLCTYESSQRFSAKEALQHPWITRSLQDPLPLTDFERESKEGVKLQIELKLRLVVNLSLFLTITKQSNIPKDKIQNTQQFQEYVSKLKQIENLILKRQSTKKRESDIRTSLRLFPKIEITQTPSLFKKQQQKLQSLGNSVIEDNLEPSKSLQDVYAQLQWEDLSPQMREMLRKNNIKVKRKGLLDTNSGNFKNRKQSLLKTKDSPNFLIPQNLKKKKKKKRRGQSTNSPNSHHNSPLSQQNSPTSSEDEEESKNMKNSSLINRRTEQGFFSNKKASILVVSENNYILPQIDQKVSIQAKNQSDRTLVKKVLTKQQQIQIEKKSTLQYQPNYNKPSSKYQNDSTAFNTTNTNPPSLQIFAMLSADNAKEESNKTPIMKGSKTQNFRGQQKKDNFYQSLKKDSMIESNQFALKANVKTLEFPAPEQNTPNIIKKK